ncbi:hypothetical protein BX616_006963 [Lobosporangium transversale]|uniref:Uncharacterized protein n=1 Tax=Lobosporangium transversale TaxID=64571 RepID=A0A1Y2H507_9FUNG|nr:hypothetical protein BCR41DRAFT_418159 [Lobosporangium transversale]KAF9915071.1 hypothetical protein BX616_006963 [Lobosporangium transversale]ORZ29094.1 hypothetical protein BCR41DRAFT_418159 [Lobosporangium transversale]|eukprot:XP_021886767.1 hypothetical protein BCR41DRAFT_418159 [Lobosporangium transversale]
MKNNSAGSLPYHSASSPRRGIFYQARRFSRGRALLLVCLGVITLLALTRISSQASFSSSYDSQTSVDESERESTTEAEREQIVKQILETRKSAYSFEDFTEEGLVLEENAHLLPATAILLGWKRLEGLKLIVKYLARYPYIKEIIVWNNNKEIRLTKQDFEFDSSFGPLPELQVYNGKENLHDFAKYMSCSLAKYQHCYFQDDDWLNTHMDALYTNFLTSPNLIHTNTLPLIHMEHRRWTFTNLDYKMHTGFSWMGTGSYVPREKAKQLLEQGGNSNLAKDRLKVIDMYFSIWTNQYPYQLVNYLTPLDQKNGWSTDGATDHWAIVFRNMLDAASRLYSALVANPEVSEKDYFPRDEEQPFINERHARSPCFNDKCLFKTSMDPFPEPKEVVYTGDLQTIDEQNAKFFELEYPSNEFFSKYSYIHAVDNNPLTCWNSFKIPQAGDSFGLQFVKTTPLRKFTITSSKPLGHLEGKFTVMVSDQAGAEWTTCHYSTRFPFSHTMALDISCPAAPGLPRGTAHNVKIQFNQNLEKSLEICGMDVGGIVL